MWASSAFFSSSSGHSPSRFRWAWDATKAAVVVVTATFLCCVVRVSAEDVRSGRAPDESADWRKRLFCPSSPTNATRPLSCYECAGEARLRDSLCDNTLWHFARKADKYKLRVRCGSERGWFCVKVVREKAGVRETERGCHGAGPVRLRSGEEVPLKEGCVEGGGDGFITTTCLCRKDLCNAAPPAVTLALSLLALSLALALPPTIH